MTENKNRKQEAAEALAEFLRQPGDIPPRMVEVLQGSRDARRVKGAQEGEEDHAGGGVRLSRVKAALGSDDVSFTDRNIHRED